MSTILDHGAIHLSSNLIGQRVFLTGHRGFIGSTLLDELQRQGCAVTPFMGDITAPDSWIDLNEDFDFVLHLAAIEHSPNFERELSVNALSVLSLARHIASMKKKPKVIFTSSTNIWGNRTNSLVDEQTNDTPVSIWSTHKLLAENYLRTFREDGVESAILRLPNIFGRCVNKAALLRSAVNRAIQECVLDNTLMVYANKECIRDFLDISDLVGILLQSMRRFDDLRKHAKVIIGSGQCVSIIHVWQEIARQYETLTGTKIQIRENTSELNASAMRSYVSSNALALKVLGYRPKVSIEESIRGTMQYLISAHKSKV